MRSAFPNAIKHQARMNLIWYCALALFALQALVPAGFMPDFSAGGHRSMTLVFCTMGGGQHHLMDVRGGADKDDPGKSDEQSSGCECAFAASAAPALPTSILALSFAATPTDARLGRSVVARPGDAPTLHPPPRGPPTFL